MSPKVIFIPSSQGKIDTNFYQEASQTLTKNGFECHLIQVVDLPENYDNWKIQLDKLKNKIDTETYFIAHSSGGLAVLRFLSENDLKIKSLNLVAVPFDENLIKTENQDFVLKQAKSFKYLENNNLALDFEKINQNCEFINFHYSKDDSIVNFFEWKEYKKVLPNGVLIKYLNEGHFKNSKISKLEEFIINQEKNSWTEFEGKKFRVKLVSSQDLPLILPEVEDYNPNPDGRSPLAKTDWIEIKNENGEVAGRRESDVMPNWAGSSWYYLRYCDPKNPLTFASTKNLEYWLPVDHYFGGNEHTTLHLLYSRFWHRFLFDQGYVPTPEPYKKRINGGILLGTDGNKMSKSKGNTINPKDVLEQMGADALRLYIAFIGPYDATVVWQEGGLKACRKLVDNIFKLSEKVNPPLTPQGGNISLNPQGEEILATKTKHLIFDFDGVIGDTYKVSIKTIQKTLNLTEQEADSFQQQIFDKPKHGRRNTDFEIEKSKLEMANIKTYFDKYVKELKSGLFEDFITEIKKIKNAKLAIVSSGFKSYICEILKDCDLEFDYIYDFETSHSKEEKVEMVCKNWAIKESDCIYFTDTKSDVLELKEIMPLQKIIGCSWGWQGFEKLKEVLPENQILKEYSDIHKVLKQNNFYTFNGIEPNQNENIENEILTTYHKFIQKITSQISDLRNNVAVAEIMTFVNYLKTLDSIPVSIWSGFLKAIAPFAVFTSEELWFKLYNLDSEKDFDKSIHLASWPVFDPSLCIENEVIIAVQVNGKVRAEIKLEKDALEEEVLEKAKESVAKWLEGKELKFSKVIPNKIVTLAVG